MDVYNSSFITARKRSLGQGNVFTHVCMSVILSTGGGLCEGGSGGRGVLCERRHRPPIRPYATGMHTLQCILSQSIHQRSKIMVGNVQNS